MAQANWFCLFGSVYTDASQQMSFVLSLVVSNTRFAIAGESGEALEINLSG